MRLDGLEQFDEDLWGAADDIARLEVAVLAREIAHQSARLGDHQRARRHVPRREAEFPEPVEPSCGDVGEIERGGAFAPHAGRALHHVAQDREVDVEMLELAEREAGADQAGLDLGALADAHALVVEERPAPARGGVEVVARRIVDHGLRHDVTVLERDRHRVLRIAVEKIGGPVEWIDDPLVLRLADRATFLC